MQLDINNSAGSLLVQFRQNCNLNQHNIEDFKAQLLDKISGDKLVIMDFSKVDFVDSAGLTMLIYLRRRILDAKGKLRLIRVGDRIKKLMQITRLHRILEVYPSIAEALKEGRSNSIQTDQPNNLHLRVKHTDSYSLIKMCKPDSLIAANCRQFEIKVRDYLEKKHHVILNFDEISYIDSAGIASLIRLKEGAVKTGDAILLVANNPVLDRLFKLYAMQDLFPRYQSNSAAVAALPRKAKKPAARVAPAPEPAAEIAAIQTPAARLESAPAPADKGAAEPAAPAVAGPPTPPQSEVEAVLAELQYGDILFLEAQRR